MDDKINDTLPQEVEAPEMASKAWCDLIRDAEKAFASWHERCERAKENYASLKRLSTSGGDRQMQLLYANLEVLKPTIYARQPQPVCKPRFSDRRPVQRAASELIERALIASFDVERIHQTFLHVRDDMALFARGVVWPVYRTEGNIAEPDPNAEPDEDYAEDNGEPQVEGFEEYVCYQHVNRKDFLHEPARTWDEVGWVARRSWLTMKQGKARFGDQWKGVHYVEAENDTADEYRVEKKAEVWELWHKGKNRVVWVHPKSDELLDSREPWLDLEGFFPCPKPAYGVCEPESLIPVPEYLFYKDQLEEVNTLTNRIHALSEALRLKGFYASGGEDVGTAVEKAFQSSDDNAVMIPVPTVAAMGQGMKDAIVWMPLREVAETITALVNLRKELRQDIDDISGISDIMRGETQASETATAQNIKAQYGSIRLRSRQEEMVRIADDTMRIAGEIMAENFQPQTLMQMTQMERIVPAALIQQHEALKKQQAMQAQMAQQQPQQPGMPPQAAPQMPQLPQLPPLPRDAVAAEDVFGLLRNEKMRPFVLQTASDSTIQPNEDAEKQRRNEFAQAVGMLMTSSGPIVQAAPEAAPLVGEMLRFVTGAYRAGRDMEQTIDEFVEKMLEKASAPPPPPPPDPKIEAMKMDAQIKQGEAQARQQEMQAQMQVKGMEAQARMAEIQAKAQHDQQMAAMNERLKNMDLQLKAFDLQLAEMRIVEAREKPKPQPARAE